MAEGEGVLNLESEELGPGVPAATCLLGDLGQVPSPLWASALPTSKILQIGEIISKLPSRFDILCFFFSIYLSVSFPGKCQTFSKGKLLCLPDTFCHPSAGLVYIRVQGIFCNVCVFSFL